MKKAIFILYGELMVSMGIIVLGIAEGPAAVGKVFSYGWFIMRAVFGA